MKAVYDTIRFVGESGESWKVLDKKAGGILGDICFCGGNLVFFATSYGFLKKNLDDITEFMEQVEKETA